MADKRPNIVLMICHDLGDHVGPYGHAVDKCPRLGALADESIRLDRHFVTSPGCSQSRSSLVTGRYPHANGQFGLAHLGWTLHRDEVLLPAALRQAGYHTALLGIWHLHDWTLAAFDEVSADVSTRDSSPEGLAEVASGRAAEWLMKRSAADQSRPFYLHVGFWETHRPFCGHLPPAPAGQPKRGPDDAVTLPDYLPDTPAARGEFAELHRSIAVVDAAVGRVLDALDTADLRDDTLVIFTADHGLPFPRAKGTLYDPGVKVAMLARWPGRITAGAATDALTSNVDVMPTLLAAAAAPCPPRVQGRNMLDVLTGAAAGDRDAVFAEKTYHEHYDPMRSVRTARYKYIRSFAGRPRLVLPSDIYNSPTRQAMTDDEAIWSHRPAEELYDLVADPDERVNLAPGAGCADVLDAMRRRLDAWMRDTDDPLLHGPVPRPNAAAP